MGLWTEYKKKTKVESSDTFLVYDTQDGVQQVTGDNVKTSFRDVPDTTLEKPDAPAESKAVGDRFAKIETKNNEQDATLKTKADGSGIEFFYNAAKGCLAVKVTTEQGD